ncbi:MAG: hypothetical protein HZB16_03705 [Armatimonadetes bacterium]|nr:hypothetical protein [Armatimonadota bacterium]
MRRLAILCCVGLASAGHVLAQTAPLPNGFTALADTPDAQSDLRLAVTGPSPLSLVFAASDAQHGYRFDLSATASLLTRLDRPAVDLATGPGVATPREITLRRRESMLYVIVDGQRLLAAMDGSFHAGRAGCQVPAKSATKVAPVDAGYQPVEDVYFTDDFMRTKDQQQLGVWQHVAGKWRFYSVSETNPHADMRLSVNPFSLGLTPEGGKPAAVLAGQRFWDDYEVQTSVKGRGATWGGLIFGARSATDYFLLRADLGGWPLMPRRIELVRVEGERQTVLAGGTTMLSNEQWFRLGARVRGDRLSCLLDGDVLFERVDPALVGGSIGLWSAPSVPGAVDETLFDDVRCLTNLDWPMDRAADLKVNGAPAGGSWRLAPDAGQAIANDAGRQKLVSTSGATSRYLLGDPVGGSWRLDTVARADRPGWVGLLFGWRDDRNYATAVWDAQGNLSIIDVADGKRSVRAVAKDVLAPGVAHRIALDLLEDGRVNVRRDGQLRLRAAGSAPAGRLGVTSTDTTASFGAVRLRQDVSRDTEIAIDDTVFASDPFMLNWASSLADWYPAGGPENNPAWTVPAKDAPAAPVAAAAAPAAPALPALAANVDPKLLTGTSAAVAQGTPTQFWHKGDFFGSYHLVLPTQRGPIAVLLNATNESWKPAVTTPEGAPSTVAPGEGDGYVVTINGGGTDQGAVALSLGGKELAKAPLPKDAAEVRVGRDGGVTWVALDDRDLLCHHDAQPAVGTRVALWTTHPGVLWDVRCRRDGVVDEVFESAPADWVQQGEWIVTNRFSCTPTWSHMTGMGRRGLAALWSKYAFTGDMTVEYYAGMRMQSDLAYYYPRVGDFNMSFACRPFDLESGISLIPSAWDPAWSGKYTRLAQGNKTIVETDRQLAPCTRESTGARIIPVPYVAPGRDVHGAWYYMKSRLIGGKVEGYFDNVKVLDAPAPAANGDRVALWTQDDQIVVSRVRVTYTNKIIPRRLLSRDPVTPPAAGAPGLRATLRDLPAAAFDWNGSTQGWTTRDGKRAVTLEALSEQGRPYLLVRNHLPGDTFDAVMPFDAAVADGAKPPVAWRRRAAKGAPAEDPAVINGFDLSRANLLTFAYRIPPETKINLYLDINEQPLFVPLSGPTEDTPVLRLLAAPSPAVVADGKWHTLRLPLAAALRRQFGTAPVRLTDLRFGMRHEGYLTAGFGGNPAGAWYALANFALVPEVGADADLTPLVQVTPSAGGRTGAVKTIRASVDPRPEALPPDTPVEGVKTPSGPGLSYLHLQAQLEDGAMTAAVHLPLLVAPAQPALTPVDVAAPWDGGDIALDGDDLVPSGLTLTVGTLSDTWSKGLRVRCEGRRLVLTPPAGQTFGDGQKVPVVVTATYAAGGQREVKFERVYRRAADKLPPSRPVVTGAGWSLLPERADLSKLVDGLSVAATYDPAVGPKPGEGSLKITNLKLAGTMLTRLLAESIDLGHTPLMLFDYQMAAPVRADFTLSTAGGSLYSLMFTDAAGPYRALGTVPDATRDGQWHRAMVPLRKMAAQQFDFIPGMYGANALNLSESGYSGEAPGSSYRLGPIRLVKVVSGVKGFTLGWSADDAGGIGGWRYGLSADENAAPATAVAGEVVSATFRDAPAGLLWFSVQAVDRAGNAGPIERTPLLVDGTVPVLGQPSPAMAALGSSDLVVPISGSDDADLDASTVQLAVDGQPVKLTRGRVSYRGERLIWRWAWGQPKFGGPVPDGTPVKLSLSAGDYAGNDPVAATWDAKISYAADKEPPLAPEVTVAGQPLLQMTSYNRGAGDGPERWSSYQSMVNLARDTERNDTVARCVTGDSGAPLHIGLYDLEQYPYLSFDYKINSGALLHLLVYLNGNWYYVALNGRNRSYGELGAVEVVADGKWHTVFVDLAKLARAKIPVGKLSVHYVVINEYGSNSGVEYCLDNVAVFGPQPARDVTANWVDYDATGIVAGGARLDNALEAAGPVTLADGLSSAKLSGTAAGVHLLTAQSRDGAGNLGGIARRVVVLP